MSVRYSSLVLLAVLSGCNPGDKAVPPSPQANLANAADSATAAFNRGDFVAAASFASQIQEGEKGFAETRLILAAVARQKGDAPGALQALRAVPRDGSPVSIDAALSAAEVETSNGRLNPAIADYAYVVKQDPSRLDAKSALADLYALSGQRWLATVQFTDLIRHPEFSFKQLVMLTDYERRNPDDIRTLKMCAEKAPDDPAVNLALSIEDIDRTDFASARRRLESAVKGDPGLATAQGLLGELLLDAEPSEMARWYEGLPENVREAPEIWFARGLWARQQGNARAATRCLWEAARKIPTSYRIMYQLGLAAKQVDPEMGEAFAKRAEELFDLRTNLSKALNSALKNESAMRTVIKMLLESGREWEAWNWAIFTKQRYPKAAWIEDVLNGLKEYPYTDVPRIRESLNLVSRYDLSDSPTFPDALDPQSTASASAPSASKIRFANEAPDRGLDFTYYQGHAKGQIGVRMLESTGGGVGVLDFDHDGLPDLFFTQGEEWDLGADVPSGSPKYRDRLCRNSGIAFADVTLQAQLPDEDGFGQGCAAGDFNNDGFADLYVANIGRNQFLQNHGDGTFSDVTESMELSTTSWTTSCLMADLNADGSPDLFDVNYLQGEKLHQVVCNEHQCSPEGYERAPDHLYLSRADGTVRLAEDALKSDPGPGLGVVAFRAMDERPTSGVRGAREESRLSLFITNDHHPNFFLKNSPADNSGNILLTDMGFQYGLAVNRDGKPNAFMGVASGDFNRDGLIDLFVSNYNDEPDNLFVQNEAGAFSDDIAGSGLFEAGLRYVGWGTQFFDADRDGLLDLVISNGHVGDFHKPGIEYAMPTQFFRNIGQGRFEELSPAIVGSWFEKKLFSRSLATLDWNRDGHVDFVVSPIGTPVSLLTNQSEDAGNSLAIRLHAVSAARDAIGTIVTVSTDSGVMRMQLTAGDGYQATNERVLRFGLGAQETVGSIKIEWPGGALETIENVPANTLLEIVEGQPQRTLWTGRTVRAL